MPANSDRLRRLRAARASGHVPPDLLPWLCDLAAADATTTPEAPIIDPAERLCVAVSAETDRWMTRRGVSGRTIGCVRRSLSRVLKAENVTLATVADVADALDCDVAITFQPRAYLAPPTAELAPLRTKRAPVPLR